MAPPALVRNADTEVLLTVIFLPSLLAEGKAEHKHRLRLEQVPGEADLERPGQVRPGNHDRRQVLGGIDLGEFRLIGLFAGGAAVDDHLDLLRLPAFGGQHPQDVTVGQDHVGRTREEAAALRDAAIGQGDTQVHRRLLEHFEDVGRQLVAGRLRHVRFR